MKREKKPEAAAPKYEFVDLAESDPADKVGVYRVTPTRMVWTVSVVKGEPVLTDRVGETDRWRSLSPTRPARFTGRSRRMSAALCWSCPSPTARRSVSAPNPRRAATVRAEAAFGDGQGTGDSMHRLRLATPADIPELGRLIEQSVRALSVGYYTGP